MDEQGLRISLSKKCFETISRDWEVDVSHIFREMYSVADGLCNWVLKRWVCYRILQMPPDCVVGLLQADMRVLALQKTVDSVHLHTLPANSSTHMLLYIPESDRIHPCQPNPKYLHTLLSHFQYFQRRI